MSSDSQEEPVGYKHPPAGSRFRPGQSGNPSGRPRGRHKQHPYEAVLGQLVTIREGGEERRVTAAEAFLLHMTKQGLEGNGAAARSAMVAIEEARATRGDGAQDVVNRIIWRSVSPGRVNSALIPLRMAVKLDPYRDTARIKLEPWLVQAALARLGDRRLSREEQRTVVEATSTPAKVTWPDWWEQA